MSMIRLIRVNILWCMLTSEDRILPDLGAIQTSPLFSPESDSSSLKEILKGTVPKELFLPSSELLTSTAVKINFVLSGQICKYLPLGSCLNRN